MFAGVIILLLATATCGIVDFRTGFIPNRVTYPACGALIVAHIFAGDGYASIAGAAVAANALFGLYAVTGGRGLGLGDVKLAAVIGAGLGVAHSLEALAASFVAGAAACAALLITGRVKRGDSVRFGPFLALGTFVALGVKVYERWPQ